VLVYPLGYNIWLSLHVNHLSPEDGTFVGLANYAAVLQHDELLGTVGRTLVFTFGSLILQAIIGFSGALALESFPRASRVIRPLLLAPWVLPGVAVAAIWLAVLNPLSGFANTALAVFGIDPVQWLSDPVLAMGCLIVANTWKAAPYWMLMISAGLQTVPQETVEAARVDGASSARVIWHVILPALRPVLLTTTLLAFIWTFNYFDLAYLLTDGGPGTATTTLPYAIWESSLKFNRFDEAAVYSVLSVLLTSIAIVFYAMVNRRQARR
jgi:ABC-type sugar transport system permease subunit